MATPETINHDLLQRLVEAHAVHKASVIGQYGGWSILVQYGMEERALSVRRGGVRVFKKLDTVRDYLYALGLPDFDVLSSGYETAPSSTPKEDTRRQAMKRIHAAAEHDRWFRSEVEKTLTAIDSGEMAMSPQHKVKKRLAARLEQKLNA